MVAAMAVKMLMTMPMIVFHNFAFMMFKLFFDVNNIGFPPLFFCQELENLRFFFALSRISALDLWSLLAKN